METGLQFTINGQAKRITLNGRSFLVAPMTILVPGVLNGSQGSLYYPDDEVAKRPGVWNHIPITCNHPTDPVTNTNISAAEDGVLERQGIGFLVNDRLENFARKVDGYFDEQKTNAVDPRIVANLLAGNKVEVSTGLFTENSPQTGEYQGKPYTHIARNYRPDHLAILPDQRGACSVEDGCGVNNANPEGCNQYKGCEGGGKELGKSINEHFGHLLTGGTTDQKAFIHKVESEDKLIHIQPLSGRDAHTTHSRVKATQSAADKFEKANPGWNVVVRDPKAVHNSVLSMLANCGGPGGTPGVCELPDKLVPQMTPAQKKAQEKIRKAQALREAKAAKQRVAITGKQQPADRAKQVAPTKVKGGRGSITQNSENAMSKKVVKQLVANCDCLKGHEQLLEGIPTDNLQKLLKKIAVVNAVKADGALVTNAEGSFRISADDEVVQVENEEEEETTTNAPPADEEDDEPDDSEMAEKEPPMKKGKKPPTKNEETQTTTSKPSLAEMLTNASEEEKDVWNRAVKLNRQERGRLIGILTSNAKDEASKKAMALTYNKLKTEELEALAGGMRPTRNQRQSLDPLYVGPGGGNSGIVDNASDDVLLIPTGDEDE